MSAGKKGIKINNPFFGASGVPFYFHFENGKPMDHIKIAMIEENNSNHLETETAADAWSSVYIPVIPSDLELDPNSQNTYDLQTEAGLKGFFEERMSLGVVSRIDFVSRTIVDSDRSVRSAYVHFERWNNSQNAIDIRHRINCAGEFVIKGYLEGNQFVRFCNRRFFVMKVNRSPIPEANPEANVHQLAARNAELEQQVSKMQERIAHLEAELSALTTSTI
jgi:hypothetical protein